MVLLRRSASVLAVATILVVSACIFSGGDAAESVTKVAFSHRVHVQGEKLQCSLCHARLRSSPRVGMPTTAVCVPCHERIDPNKPRELHAASFFDDSGIYQTTPVAVLEGDLQFSHQQHGAGRELDCATCHGEIASSDGIPEPGLSKSDCMGCHSQAGASNACGVCHETVDEAWLPATHLQAWEVRHGQIVHAESEATVNRCNLCHRESSCQACHQEALPQSHTNFWRRRGHGVATSLDRSRCATCHRSDFCNRCHDSIRPLSHRGGFGSPQNRHCVGCHFPLAGESCSTCHKAAPSHRLAAPLPSDHSPSMNCRQCHGVGVRLPHPDKGDVCTACHR